MFSYDVTFDVLRRIVAGVFLAGFVGIWLWIAIKVFRFDPTIETPQLVLSSSFAAVSGALSGTVAAGTAAVLGIEVQKKRGAGRKAGGAGTSTGAAVAQAAAASPLIIAGVCAYFFVGVLLVIAWLVKGDAAPDAVQSFALGSIGWMGGTFVAVFATDD